MKKLFAILVCVAMLAALQIFGHTLVPRPGGQTEII